MATISASTNGRIEACGTKDTAAAPRNDMTKALIAAGNTRLQGMLTLPMYERAANEVPHTEAILLVPNKVAAGAVGNALSRAGIWIRPPPPTAASIRPAQKAREHRIEMSSMVGSSALVVHGECGGESYQ